jgi:D-alanyl-D-alanine carboxypeptidase/Putative peptidoglycan binding domain
VEILRRGSEGETVRVWQNFLVGLRLLRGVDGVFGPRTEAATVAFQKTQKLQQDGAVGPQTFGAALQKGLDPGTSDPTGGTSGADWPPPPVFAPLVSNLERQEMFGEFAFERIAPDRDDIKIRGSWEAANIVTITVPQLAGVQDAPSKGRIRVHKLVKGQSQALFEAWQRDGLMPLVRVWNGSFVPRFVRGSSVTLSSHSWGAAFDINYPWNKLGHLPALRGLEGSVRELVPHAHEFGFYWGGHFSRRDGNHFEVARVLG